MNRKKKKEKTDKTQKLLLEMTRPTRYRWLIQIAIREEVQTLESRGRELMGTLV